MCVAIVKPADCYLRERDIALAHAENGDGCGFTVRTAAGLLTRKGLWTLAEFWRHFRPYAHLEALVHFRWASRGVVSTANCHPFQVTPTLALVHNGHFAGYGTSEVSDTRAWVAAVLRPLLARYPDALADPVLRRLLEDALQGSKVALLGQDGPVILGEADGVWEDGIWYSQTDYRYARPSWRGWRGQDDAGPAAEARWTDWEPAGQQELWSAAPDGADGRCVCCGFVQGEVYPVCGECLASAEEALGLNT